MNRGNNTRAVAAVEGMNRGKDYTGSGIGGGHESGERLHGQQQWWRA